MIEHNRHRLVESSHPIGFDAFNLGMSPNEPSVNGWGLPTEDSPKSTSPSKHRRHQSESKDGAEDAAISGPLSAESIYTNLIITEHALRSQYIELQHSRRRGLLFFWGVLAGAALLTYRVRYDPSIYRFIKLIEQLLMIASYISCGLFFLTGMYTKVFAVAPRFLADTNKGLKTLNCRLVKCRTSLKEKAIRYMVNPVYAEDPAGPVKLVLSTREFTPDFIENWEIFRDEYWERQRRRRQLRRNRRKETKKSS